MRLGFSFVWKGGLVISGLVALLLVGGLAFRAYCQHRKARALAIDTPGGIDEGMFARIGGIEQWIQIRGESRSNPAVIILHGGPGFSYTPFTEIFRPWEKHFTVVQWDQRGAGRTYGRNGKAGSEEMSIGRMAQDGIEVAEFVRNRLGTEKVILLAHSWGTILGMEMVARRPDLFHAYVGTGQIVDMPRNEDTSYNLLLERVRMEGDEKAVKALEGIGRPPYKDFNTWMVKGRLAVTHAPPSSSGRALPNVFVAALTTPGYSLKDAYSLFAAFGFSSETLFGELMAYDARRLGTKFEVPIFILQGDSDLQSPSVLAAEYFSSLEAPRKELVMLKGEGHTALLLLPDVFLTELLSKVRPLAVNPPPEVSSSNR
ncbi:MAG TPA: alpha/beta hydrolase [Pyrinomonadaceae bacterium]|jgi:pimeloyl-ACP methyl ester carboxylesterase